MSRRWALTTRTTMVMAAVVGSIAMAVYFTDIAYSNQTPLSYSNNPYNITVEPGQVFLETATVGDYDTFDRDNGKSYPLLCNDTADIGTVFNSGSAQVNQAFNGTTRTRSYTYTITARQLPAGETEHTYVDELYPRDNQSGVLHDTSPSALTCNVKIKLNTEEGEDPPPAW